MYTQWNPAVLSLTEELIAHRTGVVAEGNAALFARLQQELPLTLHRYASGDTFNGWLIPDLWDVEQADLFKDGRKVFDGMQSAVGVALYSKSFTGELSWEQLQPHLVTNPDVPTAHVFHCMWQYRPWEPDWALCVPYEIYQHLGPGRYDVRLRTRRRPGEMLVGEYEVKGRSDKTIVLNAHTCHPHMANDGMIGVAMFVHLAKWLAEHQPYYTYRLIFGPEHLGTVFYMRNRSRDDLRRLVSGIFAEMAGVDAPLLVPSTFLGGQTIDRAVRNAARHYCRDVAFLPWRAGAGNDETVWEAPGYEVPFVELTRFLVRGKPYPEYHTSLDTIETLDHDRVREFYLLLQHALIAVEKNAVVHRNFDGLVCLSNPAHQLYVERPDPAVNKFTDDMTERWGVLQDSLPRYFDGRMTILEIAEKHDLPFAEVYRYIQKFERLGLVRLEFVPIERHPVTSYRDQPQGSPALV